MKFVSCREAGKKDCDYVASGETEEELLAEIREHGQTAHLMKDSDFTPELMKNIKGVIKDKDPRVAA